MTLDTKPSEPAAVPIVANPVIIPSQRNIIPDMPEISLRMYLADLDAEGKQADRVEAGHKLGIAKCQRWRWDIHVRRGEVLSAAKGVRRKRDWCRFVEREVGMSRGHADKLILVYKDPEGTWERSRGNLSRVTIGHRNVSAPETKRVSDKVILARINEVTGYVSQGVSSCAVCEAIRDLQDAIHDRPHRDCAGCEVGIQGRREIEAELKRETLHDHPVWPWVKKLVIHSGKNRGECRPDEWVKKHLGTSYDELAEDLGYERGEVRAVGHRPRDYDLMPSEALKGDLTEAYRLARELKKGR